MVDMGTNTEATKGATMRSALRVLLASAILAVAPAHGGRYARQAVVRRGEDPDGRSAARAIGSYARGCMAGAIALPINGPTWQVIASRATATGHAHSGLVPGEAREGCPVGRLERPARRRHGAAARRPDADRPRQPPDRPRRRHLADADAVPRTHGRRARNDERHVHAGQDRQGGGPEDLHRPPVPDPEARRLGARGRTHLRQPGDQEGALRTRQRGDRPGCATSAPGGGTTSTSTSGSTVRPRTPAARRRSRRRPATAAAPSSTPGSSRRRNPTSRRRPGSRARR